MAEDTQRNVAALFLVTVALLAAGGASWLVHWTAAADVSWIAATLLGLGYSVVLLAGAFRRRELSVDVIAVLALAGALGVGEPFAGAVIAVMLASGRLLEARAEGRARRDLRLLLERRPRIARKRSADGVREVAVDDVVVGDRLVVASGEVVPVDGRLTSPGVLDESALTGESLPVEKGAGDDVRSGEMNAGTPLELTATATAAESTYAGVIRLVEQARASSAHFVRFADRLAIVFVPLTLALTGAAWAWSGDAVRAVAVLVVATPCPLLLAAPIAITSGLARAARTGVIIKGGGALERLARGRIMLFDKTGTLTRGRPTVTGVVVAPGDCTADDVLGLAASLDQLSPHVLAAGIVSAAVDGGLRTSVPVDVREAHGYGIEGIVDGHRVRLGKLSWIAAGEPPPWAKQARRRADIDGALTVFVGVDDAPTGAILMTDEMRPDARRMVRSLREAGISRILLVTGDRPDVAESVARLVGVDGVLADCAPADKLSVVRHESAAAATIMVGDGINDAPALAAAGIGVAIALRGATAASETADVVLTVERLDALAGAIRTARRARRIAWRAVTVGMGLSLAAMSLAAGGFLAPALGALLQEAIDLVAIGIALSAVVPARASSKRIAAADLAAVDDLRTAHDATVPVVEQIRIVADALTTEHPDLAPTRRLLHRLDSEVLPHESADEAVLVPLVARTLGQPDATVALSRQHAEIAQQAAQLRRLVDGIDGDEAEPEDIVELRRRLYALHAVFRLHNAAEEEEAFTLLRAQPARSAQRA